ncbi:hypothetical protein [Pelagibacterium montanilacus]|uniref:hypothetical protein n=1 Tax=Pelagibacterium montanilacus TaxID=2185280 RepID=UPI0019D1A85F|nr:hypothetical protein [Pelagibacterium montanilacus]
MGLRQDALRDFDPGCAQRRDASSAATLHGAAVGQNLARWWRFFGEGGLPDREPLAPLARGAEVDMHEPRAGVEAEAEEPDLSRRRLEGQGIVVRHGEAYGPLLERIERELEEARRRSSTRDRAADILARMTREANLA